MSLTKNEIAKIEQFFSTQLRSFKNSHKRYISKNKQNQLILGEYTITQNKDCTYTVSGPQTEFELYNRSIAVDYVINLPNSRPYRPYIRALDYDLYKAHNKAVLYTVHLSKEHDRETRFSIEAKLSKELGRVNLCKRSIRQILKKTLLD